MKRLLIICICVALIWEYGVISITTFAAPEGLDSLAIVGTGIPGVPEWHPGAPEGDMTEVYDGVFVKVLVCPEGTSMEFKIAGNDQWGDNWNFGSATLAQGQKADLVCGGGSECMYLTFDVATTIKITVDVNPLLVGNAATILIEDKTDPHIVTDPDPVPPDNTEDPDPVEQIDTEDTRKLTIKAPDDWVSVYIYTWEPETYGSFPGSRISKNGERYECSVPNSMAHLVITGTKADETMRQTDNITLETNKKDLTITINDDLSYQTTYSGNTGNAGNRQPAAADPQGSLSEYRVVGNADWLGNWNPANDQGQMVDMGNGIYRKVYDDVEPGQYQIVITHGGEWSNAYGGSEGHTYSFTVDDKGRITIDFQLINGNGTINVYGTGTPCMGDDDPDETDPSDDDSNASNQGSTQNQTTQPTTPGNEATNPTVTEPDYNDDPTNTSPVETTTPWEPDGETEPTIPVEGNPPPDEPDDPQSADPDTDTEKEPKPKPTPTALVNQPVQSMMMFLFGIIAVCVYLVILIARRNSSYGDITPDGHIFRRAYLSKKAVAQAVKENMPAPSDKLDQAVLDAVKQMEPPPTDQ